MKAKSGPTGLTKKKTAGGIVDTVKTVVYAVLIALVVRTVAWRFSRVGPHVGGQVRVRVIDSGINHRHHNRSEGLALDGVPGIFHVDIGADKTALLTCVMQIPLLVVMLVLWRQSNPRQPIIR